MDGFRSLQNWKEGRNAVAMDVWWTGNGPNDPSRVRHGIVEYMSVGSGFRMPCSTSMFLIRLHDPRLFSKTRSTSLGDQLDLSLMPL